jgi:hypothetical protein
VTRTQLALQLVRAGYGAALLLATGPTIRLATGRHPDRRTGQVARLLGARHLAQAALTAALPYPGTFTLGAQVDAVHAASMLLLAAVSRPARRTALTDVLPEAAFAASHFLRFRRAGSARRPVPAASGPGRVRPGRVS